MKQERILDTDTRLIQQFRFAGFVAFTKVETVFRKLFSRETKDKVMVRCFQGCSCKFHTYWR